MIARRSKVVLLRHVVTFIFATSVTLGTVIAEDTIVVNADDANTIDNGKIIKRANIGLLGNKNTLNTPFSVNGYTSKFIEAHPFKTLGDIIQNDASIRITSPAGGILDSLMIRGFPIGEGNIGEILLNGVYGVAPNYQLLPQYIDRVEVLKGPGAGLYGMSPNGGIGGVVNVVTKQAVARNITKMTTTWESDSQFGQYIDVGRLWVNPDGEMWGVRFNGGGSGGDLRQDNSGKNATFGALALDYAQGQLRTSLDLLDQYQHVKSPNRPFLASSGINIPLAPDGKKNIAQRGMWWNTRDQGALFHAEYDINDNVTLFAKAGGGRTRVSRVSEQTPTIFNVQGDVVSTLTNYRFNVNRYTLEAGARGSLTTGSVEHQLALQTSVYHDRLAVGSRIGQTVYSNIYSPRAEEVVKPSAPSQIPKASSSQLSSVALADTLSVLDGRLDIIPGARFQRVRSDNFSSNGNRSSTYAESAFTPMLGLLYRLRQPVSLYANYIEGLSKGDIAPETAENAGQVMRPYRSRQYEVGAKYDAHGVLGTLSLFQIDRPSGAVDGNNLYSVNSEQRNRGIELSLSGDPVDGLNILGSLSLIDAELTRSPNSEVRGNRPVGVAPMQANVGVTYTLPLLKGLSVNSQINYSGKQYVNQTNTQSIGSWTTVDMGAAYKTRIYGISNTFRFDVRNVFDRHYWAGASSYSTIAQGAPRSFFASVTVDF
ncbi:energy transducer TonB [Chania multitudinisentens RB-25]|uniref:Energy transducer TonB n=2 Tax=Chania TaxID=1745211 RepID=W0L3T4_9GAMM|nr:energy transducer TonB [Chania multitudinisentens RB-25]